MMPSPDKSESSRDSSANVNPDQKVARSWQNRLAGSPVFLLSFFIHLLFLMLAFYFVIQRSQEKRKQNFQEVSVKATPVVQIERKVQMAQMQKAQSAPDMTQRVLTQNLSAINLPEVTLPTDNSAEGTSKMGAATIGGSSTQGLGTAGGGGLPLDMDVSTMASAFGISDGETLGLKGQFYDFKQSMDRKPIAMTVQTYDQAISDYIKGGWDESSLNKYFKVEKPLYLPQCLIPLISASAGPESFGVGRLVAPTFTGVHYQGKVSPPESGRYRFVGFGDNVLAVRFNRRTVLDSGLDPVTTMKPTARYPYVFLTDKDELPQYNKRGGLRAGEWFEVNEGESYSMDIIIGESGGSKSAYFLLIEKEGVSYEKTAEGLPLFPLFRLSNVADHAPSTTVPPHQKNGPLWRLIPVEE